MHKTPKWLRGKPGIPFAVVVGLLLLFVKIQEGNPPAISHADIRAVPVDTGSVERDDPVVIAHQADFDFYLLAMSWHPAFCADGNERRPECEVAQPHPLAIHGLWPEKLEPGAYPHDCRAPRIKLEPELTRELAEYMPGMSSNLHEHEWRKHGGCSGLDDDVYFREALSRAQVLDAALRVELTSLSGRETTAEGLRAVANSFQTGLGDKLVFQCQTLRGAPSSLRNRPFLIEVRECIDDDGPRGAPGTLLDCGSVNRRDQGCGKRFRIAQLTP